MFYHAIFFQHKKYFTIIFKQYNALNRFFVEFLFAWKYVCQQNTISPKFLYQRFNNTKKFSVEFFIANAWKEVIKYLCQVHAESS